MYHDFAYSLLKDDGVKTKIIKNVSTTYQSAGQSLLADDGFLYQL